MDDTCRTGRRGQADFRLGIAERLGQPRNIGIDPAFIGIARYDRRRRFGRFDHIMAGIGQHMRGARPHQILVVDQRHPSHSVPSNGGTSMNGPTRRPASPARATWSFKSATPDQPARMFDPSGCGCRPPANTEQASLQSMTPASPHGITIGTGDRSSIAVAVLGDCGQPVIGPRGVVPRSSAAISLARSPPPAGKA